MVEPKKCFAVLYYIEIVLSKDGLNSYLVIRSKHISQQVLIDYVSKFMLMHLAT